MAKLIAKTPCGDTLPKTIGNVTLSEVLIDHMWSVAPYKRREKAVATALGATLPKPNRFTTKGDMRLIWAGQGVTLVIADRLPDMTDLAAVSDQSDAWAVVAVEGEDAAEVLARLVPIDLRRATFKTGHTARTMLGHMTATITRTGANRLEVMVMRSMAGTLVHDLTRAATLFAGRG